MVITPINGMILIEPILTKQSKGGIILPENSRDANASSSGKVLAISGPWVDGDGSRREVPDTMLIVGQVVHFRSYSASEITDDAGKKLILAPIDSILAVKA